MGYRLQLRSHQIACSFKIVGFNVSRPPSPAIIYGTNALSPASLAFTMACSIVSHYASLQVLSLTVCTSLSPRPDKHTTRISSADIVFASFAVYVNGMRTF